MRIEIVPCRPEHLPSIERLWQEFMEFHAARDAWFEPSPDGARNFVAYLRSLLDGPDALVLVALDAGEVVGYALAKIESRPPVFVRARHGLVSDVAVRASHRRHGIGAMFDERMEQWFEEKGIDHVELLAVAANEVSTAFWKKRGYRPQALILAREIVK